MFVIHRQFSIVLLLFSLFSNATLHADHWTRFRGPNGTGIATEAKIPTKWAVDDFRWRVELPGVGHSSPVVWKDKIFLTSADSKSGERYLICRSTHDGSEIWTHTLKASPHRIHSQNSLASATPAVDARHVYFLVTTPSSNRLIAMTHDGKTTWERKLGSFVTHHGPGSSPIVHAGLVIVNNDQEPVGRNAADSGKPGESSILALDCLTGETRWQTKRRGAKAAYSTPCVVSDAERGDQLIFTSNAHGMMNLDLKSGRVNWELDAFDLRTVSSPLVSGKLVIGTSGSGGGGNRLVAVDFSSGKPKKKYEILRSAPYVPTPVAKDGLLFLCYDKGIATCIDVQTGKTHWQQRLPGYYSGSPVIAGDHVYIADYNNAEMVVFAAADKFKLIARNPLGEPSRATPAIIGNTMYVRTESHLIAIGE